MYDDNRKIKFNGKNNNKWLYKSKFKLVRDLLNFEFYLNVL